MGVNGGSDVWRRVKDACTKRVWPWSRSTSLREGKGTVIFASTDEVLTFVYRPNLSVRDVCTDAALKVKISPVALDFFTLVSEDGSRILNPDKVLNEAECTSQVYLFRLCIKACHGLELRDIDKGAFEYYFHQCRQDFLSGTIGKFTFDNQKDFAMLVIYEIIYRARQRHTPVAPKAVLENPIRYRIKPLLQRGIFVDYSLDETKSFLKGNLNNYESIKDSQLKIQYISSLEKAEDFFVHKLSFEKIYLNENGSSQRKFEVLISAEFGIKKRRKDAENSYPEVIVEKFSDVKELDFNNMTNLFKIFRKDDNPEILTPSSTNEAYSLITLIEGYYRLMVNQYKKLDLHGSKRTSAITFHGPIRRDKAENLLLKGFKEDGSFLLRRSREAHDGYVLSLYVAEKVRHYVVKLDAETGMYYPDSDPSKGFSDLMGLVEHYKFSADGFPVCLKEMLRPNTEGLAALLDRQVLTPAIPEFHLLDSTYQLENLNLDDDLYSQWGEFGEVKKGYWWCSTAEEHVQVVSRALIKPLRKNKMLNFKECMATFSQLKNTYLTLFYGIQQTEKALIFVFEYAAEGPLDRYIKSECSKEESRITKGRVISYAAQIAEGMMFLHSKKFVHGRLSAHNVLVADAECVKISDFGLLYLVQNGHNFYHMSPRGHSYCWWSPQSLHDKEFTEESDIWSFGVTLWEMFAMKRPFHCSFTEHVLSDKEVLDRYLKGQYLNPDRGNCPESVGNLIKRCFAPKPEDRMSFRELVTELRSPELISDDEAQELLLPPNITQLEDWEIPMPSHQNELELQTIQTDSQVSNVDYACLPGNEAGDTSLGGDYSTTLPGISLISSISLFDNSSSRKRSLSKTFSFPGLVFGNEAEGTAPSKKPLNLDVPRQLSVTRVSSCPPSIQTVHEGSLERAGQWMEPIERQEEAGFVAAAMNASSVTNEHKALVFRNGIQDPAEASSEETTGSDNSNDDDTGTNDGGAEALAMRSLGEHLRTSVQGGVDVLPSVMDTELKMSFSSDADVDQCDEGNSDQLSEVSSTTYIRLSETSATASSDSKDLQPERNTQEQQAKLRAGSYVTLSTGTHATKTQDKTKRSTVPQHASTVHEQSSVGYSPVPGTSLQSPLGNKAATSDKTSEPWNQTSEHQTLRKTVDSPYQNHMREHLQDTKVERPSHKSPNELLAQLSSNGDLLEVSEESNDEGARFLSTSCKSPDELLASFSSDSVQKEIESSTLSELLSEIDDCPIEEGSSPLITDLQEESEVNGDDFRSNAELSLGKFLPNSLEKPLGLELDNMSGQSSFGQADNDTSLDSQTREDMLLKGPERSLGFMINHNQEQDEDKQGAGARTSTKNNQRVTSKSGLDFSTSANLIASVTGQTCFVLPELVNNTNCGEESEEENEEDDENLDDEVASFWPLGCPFEFRNPNSFLRFDHGQENLEMKEFPMNNLSKEHVNTSELLDFKDGHFVGQLDEAGDDDLFGDQEAESDTKESIPENPDYKDMTGLKEIDASTAGISGGNDMSMEEQHGRTEGAGYKVFEEEVREPLASLSHSSSSDGIWPPSCNRGLRTSTIGSTSSWTEETPTLDLSKIPPQLQISFEDLSLQERLGQGQFGEVRKASIISSNQFGAPKRDEVAVKVLKDKASAKDSIDFIKEVETMVQLASKQDCKYIIKLRGVSKDPVGKLMLVTELAPLGALLHYLPKNKEILRTPQLLEFCMQICKGMGYLESQTLLHRDLAARNILVMREDLVKISDFGLSRLQDYYKLQESSKVPIKWYALESLLEKRFTTKSDVWSFGVTMWEIFSYGDKPYQDVETQMLHEFLEKGKRLSCPPKCPQKVYEVMYSCWLKDVIKRPSFFLLENEYLAELQKDYPVGD